MDALAFFWEKNPAGEASNSVFVSRIARNLYVFLIDRANAHTGERISVGHFEIIVYADDGTISHDASVGKRGACFKKIRSGETFLRLRFAAHFSSGLLIITRGVERPAGRDRQLKGIDQHLGLKLFGETGARIVHRFSRYRINCVLLELSRPCGNKWEFLKRNARKFPGHLRCVHLEEGKPQLLPGARKNLRRRKDEAGFFRMKSRAPARVRCEPITAFAFQVQRYRYFVALLEVEIARDLDLVVGCQQFHVSHRGIEMDLVRFRFSRIDLVVEFDSNHRLFQHVIKCAHPFDFQGFRFSRRQDE